MKRLKVGEISLHNIYVRCLISLQLSVIVPQATAGLIIGKGGSRVKSIQEESNCHINLTQKNEHLPTNERVVTIQNNESKYSLNHKDVGYQP
jgi:predicted PilT family ATPase